jgi:hypothetical protein
MARRDGGSVRLITRNGHDFADRFPLAAAAVAALPVRSCIVDGEAIVCDDRLATFDLIRGHGRNGRAMLCAFDLIEVNGEDLAPGRSRNASADWRAYRVARTTASRSMSIAALQLPNIFCSRAARTRDAPLPSA